MAFLMSLAYALFGALWGPFMHFYFNENTLHPIPPFEIVAFLLRFINDGVKTKHKKVDNLSTPAVN